MFIRIRGDNGYPECPSCAHCESELCEMCEDGDQYEEGDEEGRADQPKQLQAA